MKVYSFSTQQSHTIKDLPENITFFSVKKDKLFYIDGENKFHITDLLHKHTNAIIPLNEALGAEKFLSYKFYVDDNLDIWYIVPTQKDFGCSLKIQITHGS